jgi:putative transposase
LVDRIDTLRAVIKGVRAKHPFEIDAWVVLPDHLHALWTLPAGDADYPTRWALIKAGFSRGLLRHEPIAGSRRKKGERGIWQRRYWEHMIRDDRDLEAHTNYIHYNPVKHGYVRRVVDWPFSTFHRGVARGTYPPDWAEAPSEALSVGEPA